MLLAPAPRRGTEGGCDPIEVKGRGGKKGKVGEEGAGGVESTRSRQLVQGTGWARWCEGRGGGEWEEEGEEGRRRGGEEEEETAKVQKRRLAQTSKQTNKK